MKETKESKVKKARVPATLRRYDGVEIDVRDLDPYIVAKDKMVRKAIAKAQVLSTIVEKMNQDIFGLVRDFYAKHSRQKEGWKGNASPETYDRSMRIDFDIQEKAQYDDRINDAGEMIRGWLQAKLDRTSDAQAKKDLRQTGEVIKAALRLNHGQPDRKKIIQLKQLNITDPEWLEAIDLINKSETIVSSKRYIRFWIKDGEGVFQPIKVNFSDFDPISQEEAGKTAEG